MRYSPLLMSLLRNRGEVVESVVSSGSVDENCFAGSDSFQKGSTVEFSYPKRMLVIGAVLLVCSLYIGIAFRKQK